jgi:hypothetical protein
MAQYSLPDWARLSPYLLAGPDKPALSGAEIGNTSVSGGGTGLLDIEGLYNAGLGQFAGATTGNGDSQGWTPGRYQEFNDWLKSTGQGVYEAGGNGEIARWMQDANGNITAEPQITSTKDNSFWNAAMLAGAVTGANLYGAYGGAGATASGGGAASGTAPTAGGASAGMTAEQVATLAANGLTDAQIASMAAAAGDTAMASSLTGAGMGGSGGLFGGMFSGMDAGKIGSGLLDYAAKNPKVVGGLLGGVAGASGGLDSGGGGEQPYTGPMPTISRGGWQPRVQAQQMALPQFGGGIKTAQGNAGSGLWRFMGGK